MKSLKALLLLIFSFSIASAQDAPPETAFDFWIGEWIVEWEGGGGSNIVTKTLDGKVIQENFEIPEGKNKGFKGTSISVYNPQKNSWHQAWADNTGGYYDFIGEFDGEKRIFKTRPVENGEKIIIQRMVFYAISTDRFTWDWESTEDGGKTWNLLWRIHYSRDLRDQ